MSGTAVAVYVGPSRDGRTNRWRITCPACGHVFEPETTMRRHQNMLCPKRRGGREMQVDYNAPTPAVELVSSDNQKG